MKKNVKVIVRGRIPDSADERPVYLFHIPGTGSPCWTYVRHLGEMYDTQEEAIAACAVPLAQGFAVSLDYFE